MNFDEFLKELTEQIDTRLMPLVGQLAALQASSMALARSHPDAAALVRLIDACSQSANESLASMRLSVAQEALAQGAFDHYMGLIRQAALQRD